MSKTAPEGYVHGFSSKIPPSHRDDLIARRRAGESLKTIATEYGCHKDTVTRAITARLIELGEYHPAEFHAARRRRRKEAWEYMKAVWGERDRRNHEAALAAKEQQARLEEADRQARRERVQAFNERQRERARVQGLL